MVKAAAGVVQDMAPGDRITVSPEVGIYGGRAGTIVRVLPRYEPRYGVLLDGESVPLAFAVGEIFRDALVTCNPPCPP